MQNNYEGDVKGKGEKKGAHAQANLAAGPARKIAHQKVKNSKGRRREKKRSDQLRGRPKPVKEGKGIDKHRCV